MARPAVGSPSDVFDRRGMVGRLGRRESAPRGRLAVNVLVHSPALGAGRGLLRLNLSVQGFTIADMDDITSTHPVVARVAVDVSLPHLDRVFDYAIPVRMAGQVAPGCRVRVRFAGKLMDGFVLATAARSDHGGALKPLERLISPEPALSPEVGSLCRAVADYYAGTLADVLRMAVPPRHAAAEAAAPPAYPPLRLTQPPERSALSATPEAERFLQALAEGQPIRAAWSPVPVHGAPGDWAAGLIEAAATTLSAGRGVLLLVPDATALARLSAVADATFGAGTFVTLSAEMGPAARYRAFLAVARKQVRLVLGTRNAVFAPVADLGLIAVWDEGNDSYAESLAPYPHTREVACLRAVSQRCALLLSGYARSAEVAALVDSGWLVSLTHDPAANRHLGPAVRIAADHDSALERDPTARIARLPHDVFTTIRAGLARGPVLVQVPRAGYVASLSCARCGESVRCPTCQRVLRAEPSGDTMRLTCGACGPASGDWRCRCGHDRWRAPVVGVQRTAEELGRAFPRIRVVESWSGHSVDSVPDAPALVLATPGLEPIAHGGYAAAVLLDTALMLNRTDLRASEESLRRWLGVCALVKPASEDGSVIAVGETSARSLQALVRLDPAGFAATEYAERQATGFPPAQRLVFIEGPRHVVDAFAVIVSAAQAEVFGPAEIGEETWRLTVRMSRESSVSVLRTIRAEVGRRSAAKEAGLVRVKVNPATIE